MGGLEFRRRPHTSLNAVIDNVLKKAPKKNRIKLKLK